MKNRIKTFFPYIIIAIVLCLGIFLLFKMIPHHDKDKESKLNEISISELETKIKQKDSFVLVISQTGCSHCEQYLPELDRAFHEVDFSGFVLNISKLNETENSTLSNYVRFSGTPTTIFFKDGVETTTLNRIVGFASKAKIIERLKSLGYIE